MVTSNHTAPQLQGRLPGSSGADGYFDKVKELGSAPAACLAKLADAKQGR